MMRGRDGVGLDEFGRAATEVGPAATPSVPGGLEFEYLELNGTYLDTARPRQPSERRTVEEAFAGVFTNGMDTSLAAIARYWVATRITGSIFRHSR